MISSMALQNIVVIAGMHRSGTSALTRAINLAGVQLPGNLMPAAEDNADGFWEPLDVVALHNRILSSLGSGWNDYRELPAAWFDSEDARLFGGDLAAWIHSETVDKDTLLVKDPRICRLLPLWQDVCEHMGIGLHAVIAFRNPIEVAGSLHKRDKLPPLKSALLWLRHFIDAERFTRGCSRSFVDFDELIKSPLLTVRRIERELSLSFPVPDSALAPLLDEALKPGLRHHVATTEDLAKTGSSSSPPQIVYPWALAAAAGKNPSPALLDEVALKLREVEQGRNINQPS
jgi:hypothetical protein